MLIQSYQVEIGWRLFAVLIFLGIVLLAWIGSHKSKTDRYNGRVN